jgi:hypothetical protein
VIAFGEGGVEGAGVRIEARVAVGLGQALQEHPVGLRRIDGRELGQRLLRQVRAHRRLAPGQQVDERVGLGGGGQARRLADREQEFVLVAGPRRGRHRLGLGGDGEAPVDRGRRRVGGRALSSSTARVKVAVPSSALVGVHTTVWVNASKRAERGIAVTSTRTSSRSWSIAATENATVWPTPTVFQPGSNSSGVRLSRRGGGAGGSTATAASGLAGGAGGAGRLPPPHEAAVATAATAADHARVRTSMRREHNGSGSPR